MAKISVKIQFFDQELPLPEYKTTGAVALDFYAREPITVKPGELVFVPLNVAVAVPDGYWLMLVARSSLSKKGLILANSVGVVDNDYCGPQDELRAAIKNLTSTEVILERGERIVQGIILPKITIAWQPVKKLPGRNRGGFGTTGSY